MMGGTYALMPAYEADLFGASALPAVHCDTLGVFCNILPKC